MAVAQRRARTLIVCLFAGDVICGVGGGVRVAVSAGLQVVSLSSALSNDAASERDGQYVNCTSPSLDLFADCLVEACSRSSKNTGLPITP